MTWGILALTAAVFLGYALWPLARQELADRRAGREDDSWNAEVDRALSNSRERVISDRELDEWMTEFERQQEGRRR